MARGRLEPAAAAAGAELETVSVAGLPVRLRREVPDVVVLDLDTGGRDLIGAVESARAEGILPARMIGYFSHVDEDLGRAAADAGVETYPRGRFWREAATLLRPSPPR